MDIRKSIKDVLDKKVSSKLKYDSIIELIDKVPVDEALYDIYIIFLKDSVFYQNSNYLKSLEPAYQKALYVTLMALEIATRMHKKIAYKDRLAFYKANSSIYAGLTAEEFDRNVMNEINGRIGAKVARQSATQAIAQQTANARQETTASNGLLNSIYTRFNPIGNQSNVHNRFDNKITELGIEYKNKIINGLRVVIEGKILNLKTDTARLKNLNIKEEEVERLRNIIVQAKGQNTRIFKFAQGDAKNKEQDYRLDKITEALTKLINDLSKEPGFLDILIGIGFAFAVQGLVVGAVGAFASNLYKRLKFFKQTTFYDTIGTFGGKVDVMVKNDYWATNAAKILDEALKDGFKQGLRSLLNPVNAKRYYQEDSKILLDSFKDKRFPFFCMMAHQFEEAVQLLLVLSFLGFLTKDEIEKSYAYFYNRLDKLNGLDAQETYINILLKEQQQVALRAVLPYRWIATGGGTNEDYKFLNNREALTGVKNIDLRDHSNDVLIKQFRYILLLNDGIESFFNELVFSRDILNVALDRHGQYKPSFDAMKVLELIWPLDERFTSFFIQLLSFSIKIYKIPLLKTLGIFLESELILTDFPESEKTVRSERMKVIKNTFFLSFLSHSNIAYYSKESFPTVPFFRTYPHYLDFNQLYTDHKAEQDLLHQLYGS